MISVSKVTLRSDLDRLEEKGIIGHEKGEVFHCQQVKGWTPSRSRGKPETGGYHGKKRVLKQSEICQGRRTMETVQRNENRILAGTVKCRSKADMVHAQHGQGKLTKRP
jgi:hypothetical protein